jgi:hypothetical protein
MEIGEMEDSKFNGDGRLDGDEDGRYVWVYGQLWTVDCSAAPVLTVQLAAKCVKCDDDMVGKKARR